jgi:hypothetical protein
MRETHIYDGPKRIATVRDKSGHVVRTSDGQYTLTAGPLGGHEIAGFSHAQNQPVHARVGEENPQFVVGNVIFFNEAHVSAGRKLVNLLSSFIPSQESTSTENVKREVDLY